VLNTAFYIFEKAFTSKFAGHELVIFDEAHALEEQILSFAAKWISPRLFERLGYTMPRSLELRDDGPWADFWEDNEYDLKHERKQLEEDAKSQLEAGAVNLEPRLAGRLRDLKSILDIAHAFHQASQDPEHWLLSRTRNDSGALELRSIWGYTQAPIVFNGKTKRLFMTGTVLSPEFLAFSLGLKDYQYIEMASDFPATQRPLYYVPTVKMSAKATSDDIDHLVMVMDEIIRVRHLGQKGIIHTVSYQLRNEIMERSRWKNFMVTHNAADRIETLERFRGLPEGFILVSPSMTTGVDLPEGQCRWQMIPKMPFPYLGDEMIRMRKDDERRLMWAGRDVRVGDLYYAWATATAIVQAYGRAMRSAEDWGHTYLLDSNFGSFVSENRWGPLFPGFFKEALRWTQLEDLGVEL
jgi:Rad3-related DNA helicase